VALNTGGEELTVRICLGEFEGVEWMAYSKGRV
jgi:hypothetical protein